MWGPGAPRFEGRTTVVAEAICYPRPLQERIPILVGGSGERRTLRLVARHADACNLFGDAATVRHKLDVLRAHCEAEGRDPAEIAVTHLAPARVVAAGEPREGQGAASVEEHVGRYRELAEAGVQTAIVGLSDALGPRVGDAVRGRDRGVPRVKRLAAALVVAVLFAAGCGGSEAKPELLTETVGSGPQTTTIIRPDVDRKLPVVLFLHGWGGNRPRYYRPWLEHLAREGNAVNYPRYQDSVVEPPPQVLGNVLAGTRLALSARQTRSRARSWSRDTPRAGRSPPTTRASRAASGSPCRSRCSAPTPAASCRGCRSASRRSTRHGSRRARA